MNKVIALSFSVGALASLSACGGAGTGSIESGGNSGAVASNAGTVSVSGHVRSGGGSPLADVTACAGRADAAGDAPVSCANSGADGAFELSDVPQNARIELELAKDGFTNVLIPFVTGTGRTVLDDTSLPSANGTAFMGEPSNPSLGSIEFFLDGAVQNANASLVDENGKTSAPVYATPSGSATPSAHGGFVNLVPGNYMLVVDGADCAANSHYGFPVFQTPDPLPGSAVLDVPVLGGSVTTPIRVTCGAGAVRGAH